MIERKSFLPANEEVVIETMAPTRFCKMLLFDLVVGLLEMAVSIITDHETAVAFIVYDIFEVVDAVGFQHVAYKKNISAWHFVHTMLFDLLPSDAVSRLFHGRHEVEE
jgi:hypothetical protein